MGFLIRPPMFKSSGDKSTRMQWGKDRHDFVLHFDTEHDLQGVRYDDIRKDFRRGVKMELDTQRNFLKNNYGNWDVISVKIADIIKKNLKYLF